MVQSNGPDDGSRKLWSREAGRLKRRTCWTVTPKVLCLRIPVIPKEKISVATIGPSKLVQIEVLGNEGTAYPKIGIAKWTKQTNTKATTKGILAFDLQQDIGLHDRKGFMQ